LADSSIANRAVTLDGVDHDSEVDDKPESESDETNAPETAANVWGTLSPGNLVKNWRRKAESRLEKAINNVEDMEDKLDEDMTFDSTETQAKYIRQYQAMRDNALSDQNRPIIDYYMELILQFGFIVLFSSVFPLAPLLCYACNKF